MEKDFDSKLKIQSNNPSFSNSKNSNNVQRSKSFAFRAPQENFTIHDFELGKIYGVGSYSKVVRAKKIDTGIVYALKVMDKKFITKENKTAYVKLERIVLDQLDNPRIWHSSLVKVVNFSTKLLGKAVCQRMKHDFIQLKLWMLLNIYMPENLLLSSEGHIKVADFGSVKPMEESRITVLPNAASVFFFFFFKYNVCIYVYVYGERSRDTTLATSHTLGAQDDKACTFVGTAAYVPPEVLNSSPATFGNDLWALGCTLYQMLSGTSPFKDASEWLIFQRIIARDVRFPTYFSDAAKDLIDRLLDTDPSRRPGSGRDGYVSLKTHPFFIGIDWKNLRTKTPPKLAQEHKVQSVGGEYVEDTSWNPTHLGDGSSGHNSVAIFGGW